LSFTLIIALHLCGFSFPHFRFFVGSRAPSYNQKIKSYRKYKTGFGSYCHIDIAILKLPWPMPDSAKSLTNVLKRELFNDGNIISDF